MNSGLKALKGRKRNGLLGVGWEKIYCVIAHLDDRNCRFDNFQKKLSNLFPLLYLPVDQIIHL